ncbi:hypothetical protein HDF23_003243 [Mucilaginibacter lappiensis]|uniref:Single-strand binding protein family protein n=1 Tax=Mucilaginibacter lappiensis TaxID=354630 RepID=A0ABR6PL51_9SPHI|nr:hypothetical protein [Mucilaginibacter lappiensis]MBB6110484.1 hypothetical protein [Mucilaginibacter lappiensis]
MDINISKAKRVELREIPNHIGDTICIYGHVHDFKVVSDQKIIVTQIDSASNTQPVTVEIAYGYPEAKPYLIKQLKNNTVIIYGIVTGSYDKPKVVSQFFMAEDKSGEQLAFFKEMKAMQRDTNKRSRARIVSVELLPPDPASIKKENYKHFSSKVNKKIWYCDMVSGSKPSDDKTATELYLSDSTLVILIKNKVKEKFKVTPETAFLNKQICIKGTVIVYKDKFAVNIINPKQIEILPDH